MRYKRRHGSDSDAIGLHPNNTRSWNRFLRTLACVHSPESVRRSCSSSQSMPITAPGSPATASSRGMAYKLLTLQPTKLSSLSVSDLPTPAVPVKRKSGLKAAPGYGGSALWIC